MPEVRLGINPGAGGTQRLPRLVGVKAALEMLLGGQPIDARRALSLGLIDAVARPDQLLSCAAELLRNASAAPRTSQRVEKVADAAANGAAIAKAQERAAAAPVEIIAPRKIVEVVRVGLEQSFAAGLAAEQEAFGQCIATRASRTRFTFFVPAGRRARWPASMPHRRPGLLERAWWAWEPWEPASPRP